MTKSGSFEFFEDYSKSVQSLQPEYYTEIQRILDVEFQLFFEINKRKPLVLDIGSAGILPYNVDLTENIVILDLFDKPKNLQLKKCCEWIIGDILSDQGVPEPLRKSKFDFIIMSSLLHHLCDKNNNAIKNLKTGFSHSRLLLSKVGKICIFESTCARQLSRIEDLIYPFYSRILLKVLNFTYIRMFSVNEITTCLNHIGLQTESIPFAQPLYIAQMYWRVPTKIYPLKITAIFAYEPR